jgi:hypothetical protein
MMMMMMMMMKRDASGSGLEFFLFFFFFFYILHSHTGSFESIHLFVCSSGQRHKSFMLYACMIGAQYVCSFVIEQLSLVEKNASISVCSHAHITKFVRIVRAEKRERNNGMTDRQQSL